MLYRSSHSQFFTEPYQKQCLFVKIVYATSQSREKFSLRRYNANTRIYKSVRCPLPVTKNNPAAIKTVFDPVLNTFGLDVVVAQANKASVGVDPASTIGGAHVKGNHFLALIKIPAHMSYDYGEEMPYLLLADMSNKASGTSLTSPFIRGVHFRDCRHPLRVPGAGENRSDLVVVHVFISCHVYPNNSTPYQEIGLFGCSTRIEHKRKLYSLSTILYSATRN